MSASDADVEAVATAIYNEPGPDGDALSAWLSDGGMRLGATTAAELRAEVMNLCRIAARAAIAALPSREEWRTIESAPLDRTAVWLLCDGRRFIGYFEPAAPPIWPEGKWYLKATVGPRPAATLPEEILGCYVHDAKPTHWRPLPDIPSPAKPDGGDRG